MEISMKNFNQSNPIKKERNMKRINTIATFCSLLFVISCGFQFIINAAYGIQTALGIDKFLNNLSISSLFIFSRGGTDEERLI